MVRIWCDYLCVDDCLLMDGGADVDVAAAAKQMKNRQRASHQPTVIENDRSCNERMELKCNDDSNVICIVITIMIRSVV